MRLVLNVLWFVLGGFVSGTLWFVAGVLVAITLVGLPWAPAVFRMAGFSYAPFGKTISHRSVGIANALLNMIWLVLVGWWLALHHLVLAVGLALTLIGIPFAIQHLKLARLALTPVGQSVVVRYPARTGNDIRR
jgi:uncharacterized membrane protein YccF (DUF307 family)